MISFRIHRTLNFIHFSTGPYFSVPNLNCFCVQINPEGKSKYWRGNGRKKEIRTITQSTCTCKVSNSFFNSHYHILPPRTTVKLEDESKHLHHLLLWFRVLIRNTRTSWFLFISKFETWNAKCQGFDTHKWEKWIFCSKIIIMSTTKIMRM